MWEIYAEEGKEFRNRVNSLIPEAKRILSIYPYEFDDELLSHAIKGVLRFNKINGLRKFQNQNGKKS